MPSVTETTETAPLPGLSLKATMSPVNSSLSTLRSLYPRAARAFLQRNVALTHSLLTSAFGLIQPPSYAGPDPVASQRRKWEILRITFETTLYSSPSPAQDPEELPATLRANLMLSPEPFIATLHTRSLQLFTPSSPPQKPTSAFLPGQILVTLALASLKLECTAVGRSMIEDWLARRGREDVADDPEGYAKVLELYSLHVLPRVEDWDYAEDFLQFEHELPAETRKYMLSSLRTLRTQALAASHRAASPSTPKCMPAPLPESSQLSSRSASPTPSTASTSSGSTHTATPTSPHPAGTKGKAVVRSLAHFTQTSTSASSLSIASDATSRTVTPTSVERRRSRSAIRTKSKRGTKMADSPLDSSGPSAVSPLPRPPRSLPLQTPTPRPPSTLALVRSSLEALTQRISRTKLTTCFMFFVVFPLLSLVFRVRRRHRMTAGANGSQTGGGTVEEVRRRLRNSTVLSDGKGSAGNLVARLWEEFVRAVSDTVQMGGRGLV